MKIQIIKTQQLTFGYSHPLKTWYKKGKIPLKYDFFGSPLTIKNATLDHLKSRARGGKSSGDNFVLATKENNNKKGCGDLSEMFNKQAMELYLNVIEKVKFYNFDGKKYANSIRKTVMELLNKERKV